MDNYKVLFKQKFCLDDYSIVPIRHEDRFEIMKWRNEQLYHLRQDRELTITDQEFYFSNVIQKLFDQEKPNQILFSFLKSKKLVGYGGLVHINWQLKQAEISFVMDTNLEKKYFFEYWDSFIKLIEEVALNLIDIESLFTYAFDLRPKIYEVLKVNDFLFLKDDKHEKEGNLINVKIHSKKIKNGKKT